MINTYKLIFSDEAIVGLKEIIFYLENKFSIREVEQFASKFDEIILLIKNNPNAFPVIYSNNIRRVVLNKLTSIFYIIEGVEIHILSVFDNRKNPNYLIKILKL